jgi:uncharacterized membrane protein YciS (DUF1049 family)
MYTRTLFFILRIILIAVTCIFIAKWTNVTLFSTFMHVLFLIGAACAYLIWTWIHFAIENFINDISG